MPPKRKISDDEEVKDEEFEELKEKFSYLDEFFTLEKAFKGEKSGIFAYIFKCTFCTKMPRSSSKTTTSNLHSHISHCHPGSLDKFENLRKISTPTSKRQRTSFFAPIVTQSQCDEAVKNFIIQGGHSFNTLKRPEFRNLIKALQPSKTIMTYKKLKKGLDDDFLQMSKNLKEILSKVDFSAITTDGWTCVNRSYLGKQSNQIFYLLCIKSLVCLIFLTFPISGYCVTWLNDHFERNIAVIGLKRFLGSHTFDRLAVHIHDTICEWNLSENCIGGTTDGATNYEKCFRIFSKSEETNDDEVSELLETTSTKNTVDLWDSSEDSDDSEGEEDEQEPIDIMDILENPSLDDEIVLPFQAKCGSHKLNNVGKSSTKAIKDPKYKKISTGFFGKLNHVVNLQNTSSKKAQIVKEVSKTFKQNGVFLKEFYDFD